ncbi:MAG: GNAT family N-acetyltransferase [Oscillospiraceae bacterium]|nr:GNAT family N-acetyltransferase [Oscillospiraceae bacterium]
MVSVFVLHAYQGKGVGRNIIETLEADAYFLRAWRTEVGSSLTAVEFYRKMGYEYKNEDSLPDVFGVVRLEKRNGGSHGVNPKNTGWNSMFPKL